MMVVRVEKCMICLMFAAKRRNTQVAGTLRSPLISDARVHAAVTHAHT